MYTNNPPAGAFRGFGVSQSAFAIESMMDMLADKLALINRNGELVSSVYLRTSGKPIPALQDGLRQLKQEAPPGSAIRGVGATGSARYLAGAVIGADVIKNEISCQRAAAMRYTEVRMARSIAFKEVGSNGLISRLRGSGTDMVASCINGVGAP
jgi:hypothetical protein